MPVFYALSSSGTYLNGEEKSLLVLQGCAFLLLGFFWAERVRRATAVHATRPRINNVAMADSSELVAAQLQRVVDGFSATQTPLSESGLSQKSILFYPKPASASARSASTR
jgi:hypothetical protein